MKKISKSSGEIIGDILSFQVLQYLSHLNIAGILVLVLPLVQLLDLEVFYVILYIAGNIGTLLMVISIISGVGYDLFVA